jgi:hypothetical protein
MSAAPVMSSKDDPTARSSKPSPLKSPAMSAEPNWSPVSAWSTMFVVSWLNPCAACPPLFRPPVAMGNSVTYAGGTSFISTPFGGSSQFTLGSTTTVYAGFFWNGGELFNGIPIGFDPSSGSSFVRSSGAFSPVIGTPISGGTPGTFTRSYDFSITINAAATSVIPANRDCSTGVAPASARYV